jgi:hypothetical protein
MNKLLIVFTLFISAFAFAEEGVLTEAEKNGILLMREEEKLARDVYSFLYTKWGIPVFRNISQSEQKHMDEMGMLIDKYDLTDPVGSDVPGIFSNTELRKLYNELAVLGSSDLLSALKAGAAVEELDIADLDRLLEETDKTDIRIVYLNLEKGSRNHLRSFYSQIVGRGGGYFPEYISGEYFETIVTSERETGGEITDPYYRY